MKLKPAGRVAILMVSIFAIIALVLLAAGLESLQFNDPVMYERERSETIAVNVAALLDQIASVSMWKHIVFWVGIFFIVLLLTALLPPELRKKLLWSIVRLALFALAVFYLVQHRQAFGILSSEQATFSEGISVPSADTVAEPLFAPPNLPPMLTYFISVAVLLVTFGLLWFFGKRFASMRTRPQADAALDEIASAARQSLDELSAGEKWEDAIVRCYARMSDSVSRRRGLHRDSAMTPDEFASHLTRSGLPADPVRRLTRLFESVRYGARSAGDRERDEASACLSDILRYCGEPA
ncbi:MAG: hypothetical protein HFACDABA_01763 [Anaerolineales bacterium]|nr:hypothetical protein [Anaerolineales bacterium]